MKKLVYRTILASARKISLQSSKRTKTCTNKANE